MVKEMLVFAYAKREYELVGARELDSSYDTYDEEYGWSAVDYEIARGGVLLSREVIKIAFYLPSQSKVVEIAERFRAVSLRHISQVDEKELQKAIEGFTILPCGRGDIVVFHKEKDKLLDIGKYGIFDTFKGTLLSSQIGICHKILGYDKTSVFFTFEDPFLKEKDGPCPVFEINLSEALKRGEFKVKTHFLEKEKLKNFQTKWHPYMFLQAFEVKVSGQTFTVDNQRYEDSFLVESSKIIAPEGKVIWRGSSERYVVNAISFPEKVV